MMTIMMICTPGMLGTILIMFMLESGINPTITMMMVIMIYACSPGSSSLKLGTILDMAMYKGTHANIMLMKMCMMVLLITILITMMMMVMII